MRRPTRSLTMRIASSLKWQRIRSEMPDAAPDSLLDIEEPECVNAWPAALQAAWEMPPGLYAVDLATGLPEVLEDSPVTAPNSTMVENSPVVGTITPQYPEDALDCTDWHDGDHSAFQRLFLGGEPGKQTGSEDDYQLACLIVKAKVRDPQQIEELMRAAEIARTGPREKWSRNRQYLSKTIAHALKKVPEKKATIVANSTPKETERTRSRSLAEILKDPNAT